MEEDVEMAVENEAEEESVGDEAVEDLTNSDVVTKFKAAADIANKTLMGLLGYSEPGKRVLDICMFGDQLVTQQCGMIFKSKKIDKGLAFPTCVSVNNCVCHYSPLTSGEEIPVLKEGDVVKVDVGVQIDGYPAVAAHTFVVKAKGSTDPILGKKADVILAAYYAAEAAMKCIKPGVVNSKITETVKMVSEDFNVSRLQGVLMHQMKR